ncbi:MAG: arginine--tRNA ligase [Patescibacteria group bacterium]
MRDKLFTLLHAHTGAAAIPLDHPDQPEHGDYASSIAMARAREEKRAPMEIAKEIKESIEQDPAFTNLLDHIEVAPPGFLNFFFSRSAIAEHIASIGARPDAWGKNSAYRGKKVMVEYTDPNPFKEFHIGHLMSNAIGEAISRIIELSGAEIKRVNYQGDVGLHVAKAVWAMDRLQKKDDEPAHVFLGRCYAFGAARYEQDETARAEITLINKQIFEKSNPQTNAYYDSGLKDSLDYFETIYQRLGTHFDEYFFESGVGPRGKTLVEQHLEDGIFEQSDGAVIYRGEKKELHTRVFITSEGLPTYEAKELGLAYIKQERWPHNLSIVVTGNEIIEYFRVVKAALADIDSTLAPRLARLAQKIAHVPHGMLRLPSGKMSSRTGEVIAANDLLDEAKKRLQEKTTDEIIAEAAAVGAVKYSILKQSAGKDIIFDFVTSLSFEGDSGPYLQYTHARARSVLERAGNPRETAGLQSPLAHPSSEMRAVERILFWFPDAIADAHDAYDPHYVAHYLFSLSQTFNAWYAKERIIGAESEAYNLALTRAVAATLKNGLWLLGIPAPERM